MSLFDLLSKEGRAKDALKRNLARTLNKHAQSPDRFAAMEKLRDVGSEDALYGLARRFSFVYDKGIEDEQEKEWVHDTLVAAGDKAVEAVRRYALETESLAHPLRVLEKIAAPPRMLEIADELLAREEPGYTRDPSKKVQLLTWLGEWHAGGAAPVCSRIVPYLADFDEGVRFCAVDALSHQPHEGTALAPLLDAMLRPEEESRRIQVRCAEVLSQAEWKVTSRKDEVQKLLDDSLSGFGMQHDKLVRKEKR
jgi:hypothetical protein